VQEVEVTTYDNRRIKALTLESSKGGRHAVDSPHTLPSKRCAPPLTHAASKNEEVCEKNEATKKNEEERGR
jgi:hypothetical protein